MGRLRHPAPSRYALLLLDCWGEHARKILLAWNCRCCGKIPGPRRPITRSDHCVALQIVAFFAFRLFVFATIPARTPERLWVEAMRAVSWATRKLAWSPTQLAVETCCLRLGLRRDR